MRSRKGMMIFAIATLVLLLGVGYATVSSVPLTIDGTAGFKEKELEVYYDGTTSGVTGKVSAISAPSKTREATFTVENMVLNETVTMTFEVKNYETDVAATLVAPTLTNSNTDHFTVTATCDKTELAVNGTATVTVTIKAIKTPVTEANSSATVKVTLNASAKA